MIDFIHMEEDRWIHEEDSKDKKNHSKFIVVVVLIGVVVAALIALLNREPKVSKLTLDKTNMSLGIDMSDRLTVTIEPEDAKPILIWESSDENTVKVVDGVVTAHNPGKAVVKVFVQDQEDRYALCECTVIEPDVDMVTLDILEEPIVLRPGGHQQLKVSFTPENQNEVILWSTSDESVARVSPRGKIEAIKVGLAYIIATSDRTGVSDTATVSVEGAGMDNIVVAQDGNSQTKQVPNTNPVSTKNSKPTQTVSSKYVPAKPSKTVQVSKPKSVPVANSKTVPVKSSKPVSTTVAKSSNSKNLGYAYFRGSWPNDVNGRMEFKSTHVIDSKDPKNRMASPGDYVIGEWSDGHLVQGIWYGSDNQVKGSILIGK